MRARDRLRSLRRREVVRYALYAYAAAAAFWLAAWYLRPPLEAILHGIWTHENASAISATNRVSAASASAEEVPGRAMIEPRDRLVGAGTPDELSHAFEGINPTRSSATSSTTSGIGERGRSGTNRGGATAGARVAGLETIAAGVQPKDGTIPNVATIAPQTTAVPKGALQTAASVLDSASTQLGSGATSSGVQGAAAAVVGAAGGTLDGLTAGGVDDVGSPAAAGGASGTTAGTLLSPSTLPKPNALIGITPNMTPQDFVPGGVASATALTQPLSLLSSPMGSSVSQSLTASSQAGAGQTAAPVSTGGSVGSMPTVPGGPTGGLLPSSVPHAIGLPGPLGRIGRLVP